MNRAKVIEPISDWKIEGFCACGHHEHVPFGDTWFLHEQVCPKCGEPKRNYVMKTFRWVRERGWFKPPATIEFKEQQP